MDSWSEVLYEDAERDINALFTELEGDHDPFAYQVSVRVDDISGDVTKKIFTWRGDTSYRIAKIKLHDVYIRGGIGTGFRVPGFDEQSIKDPEGGKLDWKLERSLTHEIGLRVGKDPWNFFDISVFNTELKHQPIKEDYDFGLRPDGQYGVILIPTIHDDKAYMQGLEIQSRFQVGPWDGKLSYIHTDTDGGENVRAHNPIRNQASISADYFLTSQLTLGTTFTHRGEREEHKDRPGDGDSVNLWDLQGFYRVNEVTLLGVAIRNVADEKYDRYSQTEGHRRTLWFTLEIGFGH